MFGELVSVCFERCFRQAAGLEAPGWPHIALGRDALVAAPTGSDKALAGILTPDPRASTSLGA